MTTPPLPDRGSLQPARLRALHGAVAVERRSRSTTPPPRPAAGSPSRPAPLLTNANQLADRSGGLEQRRRLLGRGARWSRSSPAASTASTLVDQTRFDDSLGPDASPTVIVDMTTGERVAHFAEVDVTAAARPIARRMLPASGGAPGRRPPLRRRASASGSRPSAAASCRSPTGFAALRDGKTTAHPLLEAMRPRLVEALDALATAGFPREDLALAWDFTVASDERMRATMTRRATRPSTPSTPTPSTFTIDGRRPGRRRLGDPPPHRRHLQGAAVPHPGRRLRRRHRARPRRRRRPELHGHATTSRSPRSSRRARTPRRRRSAS